MRIEALTPLMAAAALAMIGCRGTDPALASASCVNNFQEIADGDFMARGTRGTSTLIFILEAQSAASLERLYRDWRLTPATVRTVAGDNARQVAARQRFLEYGEQVPEMLIADERLVRIAGPAGTGRAIVERACAMQRPGVRLKQISVGVVGPDGGETLRQMVP